LDLLQAPAEAQHPPAAAFRAPEDAHAAAPRDMRSALYSLGATLFYMLTGQAPGPREGDWAPAAKAKASGALLTVLQRTLARDPRSRYATPAALLQELGHANPDGGGTSAAAKPPASKAPAPAREAKARAKASAAPGE